MADATETHRLNALQLQGQAYARIYCNFSFSCDELKLLSDFWFLNWPPPPFFYVPQNLFFSQKQQALPDNLGTLVNLEFLGLRENMLMELPPTFYLLKALKKLDVSRNGLPCLAIRTPSEGPDPAVVAAWEKIPMPSGSSGGGGDDTDGLAGVD